jgi:hypothetical protein
MKNHLTAGNQLAGTRCIKRLEHFKRLERFEPTRLRPGDENIKAMKLLGARL